MANEKRRLIDSDRLIRSLKAMASEYDAISLHGIINSLKEWPAVDAVEVLHGRWLHCNGKSNLWYCSECGEKILYNPTRRTYNIEKRPVYEVNKHCRNCGAKMDGGNADGICKEN